MEDPRKIWLMTLLLATIAGFCDTVTFVSAGSIFSAHVTGNFITFAYQLIKGSDTKAWIKLLTFPVFIISVIAGGAIAASTLNKYKILLAESILLIISGLIAFFIHIPGLVWETYIVVMLVVFAMGLQNAFGKLYAKETFGPTTMMTGNVTQASLDLGNAFLSSFKDMVSVQSLKKQSVIIGGFLLGCLGGALLAKSFGLGVVILPGLILLILVLKYQSPKKTNEASVYFL